MKIIRWYFHSFCAPRFPPNLLLMRPLSSKTNYVFYLMIKNQRHTNFYLFGLQPSFFKINFGWLQESVWVIRVIGGIIRMIKYRNRSLGWCIGNSWCVEYKDTQPLYVHSNAMFRNSLIYPNNTTHIFI